jgi:hypothetical protein
MSDREKALEEALRECSDDLAEWVDSFYTGGLGSSIIHPSEQRRYERDMGPVIRARALLAYEEKK